MDIHFLEWADEMCVLPLDGWSESVGLTDEMDRTKSKGKPVWFLTCEDFRVDKESDQCLATSLEREIRMLS